MTVLKVRCGANNDGCNRLIAQVVDTSQGRVFTDGEHTYMVPFDWVRVDGCPKHMAGHSGPQRARRDILIPGARVSDAIAEGRDVLMFSPEDAEAARAEWVSTVVWQ